MKKFWDALLVFVKTRRALYAGGAFALVILGALAFGSKEAKIEVFTVHPGEFIQEVSVSGKVVAARDVDLGFSQGGRVAGVYTTVGNAVSQGAILAEVENGDLRASLDAARATLSALLAGTRPEEIAVAEADVDKHRAILADALRDAYIAADNAIRTKLDQFIENPESGSPRVTFSTSNSQTKSALEVGRVLLGVRLASWQASLENLATGDLLEAALDAQGHAVSVASLLTSASTVLSQGLPNGIVTQSALDGYISDIASARTSVNAAVAAITAAATALNSAEKNLALTKASATADAIDAERARVKAAEANLAKTLIVAPFSGIVTIVDAKVGGTLTSSARAISLIGSDFQIESYVPEVNIALLAVGNPAVATLDAYGSGTTLSARVATIDPAETVRDGVATYRTILAFTEKDARVRAGMTANVAIRTAEKHGVIAVPQGVVVLRDGATYVPVVAGTVITDRPVTVGALSSVGMIEIVSGLADGDVIVLGTK